MSCAVHELQQDLQLSYLFISHDLAVVRHVSHRIVVLYKGRIVEEGDTAAVYEQPLHPYTRALLNAAPVPDPERQKRRRELRLAQRVETPRSRTPERGCAFADRCPHASEVCRVDQPELEPTWHGAQVACHHWQEVASAWPMTSNAQRVPQTQP